MKSNIWKPIPIAVETSNLSQSQHFWSNLVKVNTKVKLCQSQLKSQRLYWNVLILKIYNLFVRVRTGTDTE